MKVLGKDIVDIAVTNPRLAALLLSGQFKGPKSYPLEIQFDAGAAGTRIQENFPERFYNDAWVLDFCYTVQRPQAFTGNIGKGESDVYNARMPYIDVSIYIPGPDRIQVTEGMVPLENVANFGDSDRHFMDRGWVFSRESNMQVTAVLTRGLVEDEVPYRVVLTVNVLELSGCRYPAITQERAIAMLQDSGIELPACCGQ